jgi:hypothetical protein
LRIVAGSPYTVGLLGSHCSPVLNLQPGNSAGSAKIPRADGGLGGFGRDRGVAVPGVPNV